MAIWPCARKCTLEYSGVQVTEKVRFVIFFFFHLFFLSLSTGVWGFKAFPKLQTIQTKLEGDDGFQSDVDTSLRCLNFGITLLQWMIVGLLKRFLSGH